MLKNNPGRGSAISPAAVQTLLDSASNAADKGQAQWFTPLEWARILSLPLNDYRPVIADLMCGNGSLLKGSAGQTCRSAGDAASQHRPILLGCDIDPTVLNGGPHAVSADVTKFYSKLRAVDWQCDTFVLNPPWDLHWYREGDTPGSGLDGLSGSDCPAVREAFAAHDGRTPRECIDSTIATLCIALDRSSNQSDGFLIGNESTLQRLLFADNAPHRHLAAHIWAHIAIEGNICNAERGVRSAEFRNPNSSFHTGVVWFARSHDCGPQHTRTLRHDEISGIGLCDPKKMSDAVQTVCEEIKRRRYELRIGPEAARYLQTTSTAQMWQAAKEEHERELGLAKTPPYNIWFDAQTGTVRTYLNTFDTASGRVDKVAAASLHALNGRQPIQLVVQRNTRRALENAVGVGGRPQGPWRVDPALMRAVESAIVEYNLVRAPLYPLPKIQRLGYLDEQDDILCSKDLKSKGEMLNAKTSAFSLQPSAFTSGRRYALRSATVAVKRTGTKMNTIGQLDDVEWNGQELAFFITDDDGVERCFMEERLRAPNVKINLIRPGTKGRKEKDLEDECAIDFTLRQLVDCFVIPEVPDVASLNPKRYEANRQTMLAIARSLSAVGRVTPCAPSPDARPRTPDPSFSFKQFQLDDYARASLHDGIILGHDTGLGKTIAMFIWPLLKVGCSAFDVQRSMFDVPPDTRPQTPDPIRPAKPVLLVVPGDGHDQTEDEYRRHFGHSPLATRHSSPITRLDSQATFSRLAKPDPRTGSWTLPPGYYLTSYTQLTGNGVAEFPPLNRLHPERTMSQLNLKEADAMDWWNRRGQIYAGHYERLSHAEVRLTPDSSLKEIEGALKLIQRTGSKVVVDLARESFRILEQLTPTGAPGAGRRDSSPSSSPSSSSSKRFNAAASSPSPRGERAGVRCHQWEQLSEQQQQFVRSELVITRHREFRAGIGETRLVGTSSCDVSSPSAALGDVPETPHSALPTPRSIKCVYSPSLADLCQDCFSAIVIDEGTKIKGDTTIVGTGVRQINADYRLVLTATPIKNRFPDVFHLAHYVCGGHDEPTPRFPYGKLDKQPFAEEFLVSERNLSKEENSEDKRRFVKFTPQVCNVHRAWKLLAPVILRRRKDDCGEDIVQKIRHVVRVPMGLGQAAAYQFHLKARYQDCNGRPAVGAKLQALRIAAANPASELLINPEHVANPRFGVTPGAPRSRDTYIPKVASTLELVRQVLERGEQAMVFSAFQNGLDVFSARLKEAGVPHLLLDGRLTQKRRGELARQFKAGNPRAIAEGLVPVPSRGSASTLHAPRFPIALCGAECMAELHSFHLCNNVILTAYSWAFDKFEQGINRAHRLNSPWPVNVWSVICDGSIDRKLEAGIHEKKDAAELVLDGHLLGETPEEVNLAELLHIAEREFKTVKTLDEHELEQGWPRLRAALGKAFLAWNGELSSPSPRPLPSDSRPKTPDSKSADPKPEIVNRKSQIVNDLPLWRQRFLRGGRSAGS